jgi:starch phosphorylase
MIAGGYFSADERDLFRPIVDRLTSGGDPFFVLADFASYVACQDVVDAAYRDEDEWTRRAILNVAGMGRFSSDRAIQEYANRVWRVTPVDPATSSAVAAERPAPVVDAVARDVSDEAA